MELEIFLILLIFRVRKLVLNNEIIDYTRMKKDHKNFAHYFGDNYLTNYLVKFQQYRTKP